jgi:hypothetical protein
MNNNTFIINLAEYKKPVINESSNREDWVEFGEDNNYFNYLIERYRNSTTHQAIVNSYARLLYGKGLKVDGRINDANEYARVLTLIDDQDLRNGLFDLKLLGNCAFQIIYEKGKMRVFHIPVANLRAEKCNEDGEIEGYYYSDNWEDTRKYPPKRLPSFGKGNGKEIEILWVMPYSIGQKYYALPDYIGAMPYIVLEEEISDYLINEVQNGFSGTKVVNFNSIPDEEKREDIKRNVERKLTGSRGAKVIVSFQNNKDQETTVNDIPLNDAPEHYTYLSEECLRKIMLAHGVTSPLIFGIATTTGFSANADELKNSSILNEQMNIEPIRDIFLGGLYKLLKREDIALNLKFETLQPDLFLDKEEEQNIAGALDVMQKVHEGVMNVEQATVYLVHFFGFDIEVAKRMFTDGAIERITNLKDERTPLQRIMDEVPDVPSDYILVDEREVDYDLEVELDQHLNQLSVNLQKEETTFLSKVWNLVATGTAFPNSKSSQDKKVDDNYFMVRYRYTGNNKPQRDFCKAMMGANKLYRKEDIERMSSQKVNEGLGEFGSDTYDIFLYKGGARCHHKWSRVTFMNKNKIDALSPNAKKVGTREAEIEGYKVTNPWQVSVYPNNLPLKGFSPNNKNLPSDVK